MLYFIVISFIRFYLNNSHNHQGFTVFLFYFKALWMSGPSSIGEKDPLDGFGGDDTESIMSFSSSTATMSSRRPHSHQLGTKVLYFLYFILTVTTVKLKTYNIINYFLYNCL